MKKYMAAPLIFDPINMKMFRKRNLVNKSFAQYRWLIHYHRARVALRDNADIPSGAEQAFSVLLIRELCDYYTLTLEQRESLKHYVTSRVTIV